MDCKTCPRPDLNDYGDCLHEHVCQPQVDDTVEDGCGACGGDLVVMGDLGATTWARCRDCGWDQVVS